MSGPLAVEMRGIVKRFGPVVANAGVDLAVARGEIHCLLGENGAGKSTLMKILFGLYPRDAGDILLYGRPVSITHPAQAIALGIGMVHQHFMLVDRLTVTENLIAGMEPTRFGLIDFRRAREKIEAISRRYGLAVDPDARVEDLSVGQQQRVEIVKALMRDAQILILDEPTAVLTPSEVDHLFQVMQQLKTDGKTIIFITHKLRETMAFSDRVTVLRQGRNVGTLLTRQTSPEELAELMVGRKVTLMVQRPPSRVGEPVLRLEGVSLQEGPGRARLQDIHLEVREGEIVGIAGVDGNGQLELEEVVCGLRRPTAGRVLINGQKLGRGGPRHFRVLRGAHIPSDRLRRGLVPSMPLTRNAILGHHWRLPYARRGILQTKAIHDHTAGIIRRFAIRTGSMHQPAGSLSGGNQQKLVVGREIAHDPRLIIAAQPTRGVDVGAVQQIHEELLRMRSQGRAILLISTELDELLALSDRLAVLYEGRIVAQGPTERFTERQLGLWMAGQGESAAATP